MDVLFELAGAPPHFHAPWPPFMNILLKRSLESGLFRIEAPGASVHIGGMQSSPNMLFITDKGRQFVAELGLHEM